MLADSRDGQIPTNPFFHNALQFGGKDFIEPLSESMAQVTPQENSRSSCVSVTYQQSNGFMTIAWPTPIQTCEGERRVVLLLNRRRQGICPDDFRETRQS